jgi:exodeoxyribonuclease V alpha subunit
MRSKPTESGAEILAGLVERVTFHNEENGFAVLRVKARGKRELVTVVGHAAVISAGEFIQASGASEVTDRLRPLGHRVEVAHLRFVSWKYFRCRG